MGRMRRGNTKGVLIVFYRTYAKYAEKGRLEVLITGCAQAIATDREVQCLLSTYFNRRFHVGSGVVPSEGPGIDGSLACQSGSRPSDWHGAGQACLVYSRPFRFQGAPAGKANALWYKRT